MSEKLNKGFKIPKEEWEERIELRVDKVPQGYDIVPLKRLKETEDVRVMDIREMEAIIRHIPLMSAGDVFPYKNAEIIPHPSGPNGLHTPQKFVLERKMLSIIFELEDLYKNFNFPGITSRQAHYVIGKDSGGKSVCGIYLPALVEVVRGRDQALLIDGNHRMTLAGRLRGSMESILIKGSSVDPPYEGIPWREVRHLKRKPSQLSRRYEKFNPVLLKNFGYPGIDG